MRIVPELGRSSPAIMLSSVVLPHPLRPTIETNSLLRIARLMSSSATARTPSRWLSKRLVTWSMTILPAPSSGLLPTCCVSGAETVIVVCPLSELCKCGIQRGVMLHEQVHRADRCRVAAGRPGVCQNQMIAEQRHQPAPDRAFQLGLQTSRHVAQHAAYHKLGRLQDVDEVRHREREVLQHAVDDVGAKRLAFVSRL